MVSGTLPVFLAGTLAVELRESLHFGNAALGVVITLYYLGAAVGAIPLGRLSDEIGAVRMMRASALSMAALLLCLATVTSSWSTFAILLTICGVVSSAISTATNLFIARRIDVAHQGMAFGVKQSAVPFAALLGGLAVPVVALTVGWRWAFGLTAIAAPLTVLLLPSPKTKLADRRNRRRAEKREALALGPLTWLSAGMGLGQFAASSLAAFIVIAAVEIGIGQGNAGLIAALASVTAMAVRLITGYRADKRGEGHFRVVARMALISTAGYVLLAIGSGTASKPSFVIGAMIALGAGWGWNGLFNFAVVRSHPESPGGATGVTQVGARLGGVAGPVVVGLVAYHASYLAAWLAAAVATLAASACIMIGRRLLRATRLPEALKPNGEPAADASARLSADAIRPGLPNAPAP